MQQHEYNTNRKNTHIGRNIKRIREIQGIKQEHFGQLCLNKYSQQRISAFENMIALDEPNNNEQSEKLIQLLEKMIEEDRIKTQSIAELSKAILQLTNQVINLDKKD